MKRFTFKKHFIIYQLCTFLLLAIAALSLLSFTKTNQLATELWQQLGISQKTGTEKIKASFVNNYLEYYGVKNAKDIAANDRVAIAKDLLTYAKDYLNSAVFKTDYEALRANAKPVMPDATAVSKETIRKEKVEEAEKAIKETEELIKTANEDLKPTFEAVLEIHKSTLKNYKDPKDYMIEAYYQDAVQRNEQQQKDYKEDSKNWEIEYPADYRQFIKTRLQKYVSIATTVDFAAETVLKNGKYRFTNASYESKNSDWKMIYRAGKDVYNVAQPFAAEWLKEIK